MSTLLQNIFIYKYFLYSEFSIPQLQRSKDCSDPNSQRTREKHAHLEEVWHQIPKQGKAYRCRSLEGFPLRQLRLAHTGLALSLYNVKIPENSDFHLKLKSKRLEKKYKI